MAQLLKDRNLQDSNDDERNPARKKWKPDGWDANNSGYDSNNPSSKAKSSVASSEINSGTSDGNKSGMLDAEKNIAQNAASTLNMVGKGFTGATPQGRVAMMIAVLGKNKKKTAAGGGILATLIAIFLFFFLTAGPLKLVHLGNLLERFHMSNNLDFSDNRFGLMRYFRTGDARSLRLGRTMSGFAEKWDIDMASKSGLRSVYAEGSKRFIGYEVVDEVKARQFLDELDADGINTRSSVPEGSFGAGAKNRIEPGGQFVDLRNERPGSKRSIIRTISKGTDIEDVPGSIASRVLIRYGGVDFSPLKNLRRKATDPIVEWSAKVRRERAERNATGIDDTRTRLGTDIDDDGVVDEVDADTDTDRAVREAGQTIDDLGDTTPTDPNFPNVKANAKLSLTSRLTKGAAALVGAVCATRAVGNAIEAKQYINLVLPMIRISTMYMSIGSQIKAGQGLSSEEIATYANDLFDPITGLDIFAAAPFVSALATTPGATGVPIPPEVEPAQAGEKPAFFRALDNPVIGGVCGVESFISGLPVIKQIGDVSDAAVNKILGVVGLSPEKLIESLVSALAGSTINFYAVGAELGNYLMYGGRLAANMFGASYGAAPLDQQELEELNAYNEENRMKNIAQKSFFDRMFDIEDSDSLAANITLQTPTSASQAQNIIRNYAVGVFNPMKFIPSTNAYAQASTFDYGGLEAYGFSLSEQNNPLVQDPYENAAYVEENIDSIASEFGDCFNKRIDPNTLDLIDNERERMDVTEEKCHGDGETASIDSASYNTDLLRYRMYLADRVFESAMGCYEQDEASCEEVGFANTSGASQPTTLAAPGLNGYTIPCTGQPTPVQIINDPASRRSDWSGLQDSGVIGIASNGDPIKVYIREACNTANPRTVLIVSSIHGSENGGQLVGHELLYNETLPSDVRIIVVPELNPTGIKARAEGTGSARVNANQVNLNRNFDYRWSSMDGIPENIRPTAENNYRGTAPFSEPESRALRDFILSLGNINVSLHYHDDLDYAAASHSASWVPIARIYAETARMPLGNSGGPTVLQRGSSDGWQAETTNKPVLLIELGPDQSSQVIQNNVNAIKAILDSGGI